MLGKRRHLALSLGLTLVIALLSVMTPQPVLAVEVQVKTEEKLRQAVETAAAGDVIQVIAHINLAEGALRIKHNKPLTITSKNHSVISVSGDYGMILSDGARLTLAGNLKWESTALYGVAYLTKSSLTLTDQVVIRTQGTTSGIYCKEDSQVYMTGGSIEVTKADMGDAFGIMSESSSQVEVTGGSIQVTHKGSYKTWGIRVDKDSKLDMTGGSITVSGASESVGIEANNSDIDVMNGTISVDGKPAAGIRVWNGILNMADGKITADGKDTFSRGIHLIGSPLNLYGGSIRATAAKDSLGIVAEQEGLVKIHYNPSKTTQISGKTAGITLMKQSLADVAISTFLTLKGGIHDESGIMLGNLPAPLYLAAGKSGSLKLEGVQAPLSYAIDPATFSQLNVKAASGNNAFTLSSPIEGRHELVLRAIRDSEKNIVRLHIPVTVTKIPFSDVAPNHWALTYIKNLYNKTIIKGYPNGTFRPGNPLLREHAAKMIAIGADLKYQGKKANFPDVDPKGEMSPYIAALVEKGAIKGFPDGKFRPTQNIKRYQIAQIVVKAFDLEMGKLPSSFPDLPAGEAGDYIKILASNGIVKGYPDGNFKPQGETSRAEFCKILTVAMAVSGVQQAEVAASFTVSGRDILTPAIAAAQALIDVLPDDQDLQTKAYLQARLDALK